MTTAADVQGIHFRIKRKTINAIVAGAIANQIDQNSPPRAQYVQNCIAEAKTNTRPGLLVVNFFEGVTPTAQRLNDLVIFADSQFASYQQQGVGDPELGVYEALGLAFKAEPSFAAKSNGRTLQALIQETYQAALGRQPTQAQVDHFVSQHTYFYGLYVGAGQSATEANNGARAAVVGQILGYGGKDVSTAFSAKATAWMVQAGDGIEGYGVPL